MDFLNLAKFQSFYVQLDHFIFQTNSYKSKQLKKLIMVFIVFKIILYFPSEPTTLIENF